MISRHRKLLALSAVAILLAGAFLLTRPPQTLFDEVEDLLEERRRMDETVWAREVAAQKYEETVVKYWDRMLKPEDDKFAVLAEIPFRMITLDAPGDTVELDWGIKRTSFTGTWKKLEPEAWRTLLAEKEDEGYTIDAIEFHMISFEEDGEQAVSVYDIMLNVAHEKRNHRQTIRSKLRIEWSGELDETGHYIPRDLILFDTRILEREGPPVFERTVLKSRLLPLTHLIAHDLNGDGLSEILLPSDNLVLWNRGEGRFEEAPLIAAPEIHPPTQVSVVLAGDFSGDGHVDLLCHGGYRAAGAPEQSSTMSLFLFHGDAEGSFRTQGTDALTETLAITTPTCMTAGDIDGDGDLDVWLAQYKNPYQDGQMPTPFYNANDGNPSYLLLNRGNGVFDDATVSAGLGEKRYRRTYGASFVDLDADGDLDLLVTSDFAGSDVYFNDGTGHFVDETESALREASNFGMSHTFGDYDMDGALDFYVTGMASTTMRRLNQMGLIREDRPEYLDMRTRMGYGNRMYLARGPRTFHQPEFKDSVARSGWAWGSTTLDFDSDGDMDIYVANGHRSADTTKDYCTQFWCHDIYTGGSEPSPVVDVLFYTTLDGTQSWDGYQKNHLFMNLSGEDFVNVAYLMNAAIGEDARSVLTDDFNGDGRPDLLVTTIYRAPTTGRQFLALHLLLNRWPIESNWIGVRLQNEAGGPSPLGAVIRVRSESREQFSHVVTGDSFKSQHAPMKHFGLGEDTSVDSIEVRWPDGTTKLLEAPEINQYHLIDFPAP